METQTSTGGFKNFLRENFAIILAFLLPAVLVIVVALSTYLPSAFLSTNYNFVYTSCTDGVHYDFRCDNYFPKRYTVVDGRLLVNPINPSVDSDNNGVKDVDEKYSARLFLHDTLTNESREITKEEAMSLTLSDLLTSPDGVTISNGYNRGGGDFFYLFGGGGSSSYGHYLTKGKSKKRLDLINDDGRYYYWNNFQFIGWVMPGRN